MARFMVLDGASVGDVARALDVAESTVEAYLARSPRNRITDSQAERIRQLALEGWDMSRIARETGVSPATVSRYRAHLGSRRPPRKGRAVYGPEVRERALYHLRDGASYADVSRTTGVSVSVLQRWWPGFAWTRQMSNDFRSMKMRLDKL